MSDSRTGTARKYLRHILSLPPGHSLLHQCMDKGDQEVMRVIMTTERKRLEEIDPDAMMKIRITKKTVDGNYFVQLTRKEVFEIEEAIMIAPDGTISKERLLPTPRESILERLAEMIAAGLTMEQIKQFKDTYFLKELFPNREEVDLAIEWTEREIAVNKTIPSLSPKSIECS